MVKITAGYTYSLNLLLMVNDWGNKHIIMSLSLELNFEVSSVMGTVLFNFVWLCHINQFWSLEIRCETFFLKTKLCSFSGAPYFKVLCHGKHPDCCGRPDWCKPMYCQQNNYKSHKCLHGTYSGMDKNAGPSECWPPKGKIYGYGKFSSSVWCDWWYACADPSPIWDGTRICESEEFPFHQLSGEIIILIFFKCILMKLYNFANEGG